MNAELKMDFDPQALRARYREERDRRLRADGSAQYVGIEGRFAHFLEDPWADPGFTRPPITQRMEVLIIGGGFSGLPAAARLREEGIEDVRLLEKASDFGGTLVLEPLIPVRPATPRATSTCRCSKRPATCPRPSTRRRRVVRACASHRPALRLVRADLLPDRGHRPALGRHAGPAGSALTDRNDRFEARHVVLASGLLHRAKLPGIEGLGSFEGHSFHTSRWDYGYTGGNARGGLTGLPRDKRVGIIGTGATAVQCVPHLGASAKELFVFQRTPSSVDVRNNRPPTPSGSAA
jgi:cyclohexanone monooxygenase